MAKKRMGKKTRFHLTAKGETALAWVGGVVVVVLVALLFMWGKGMLFPAGEKELARLAKLAQEDAAATEKLVSAGTFLRAERGVEVVLVDRGRWTEMPLLEREQAACAAGRHLKARLLFFDDPSGARLGWYQEGVGYREPPAPKKD